MDPREPSMAATHSRHPGHVSTRAAFFKRRRACVTPPNPPSPPRGAITRVSVAVHSWHECPLCQNQRGHPSADGSILLGKRRYCPSLFVIANRTLRYVGEWGSGSEWRWDWRDTMWGNVCKSRKDSPIFLTRLTLFSLVRLNNRVPAVYNSSEMQYLFGLAICWF